MLTNEQIISISMKQFGEKPFEGERLKELDRVILYFQPKKSNLEDIPVNGGASYIDENTDEIGFMTLLEMIEYKGESEEILFYPRIDPLYAQFDGSVKRKG